MGDHVLSITAVVCDSRYAAGITGKEISATTSIASAAISSVPADSNALARLPSGDPGSRAE
jgi:hypothetical protein